MHRAVFAIGLSHHAYFERTGNLPTERVTKRDLFRIFHKHGRLAQVSIKQAYGFVQFLDTTSCASALRHEQGSSVRGRKMRTLSKLPQRTSLTNPYDIICRP
jgi:RNA recognition motif-containing protein